MGDGYGSPIIGGLGTLIRDNIRSRNYVAGTSGWAIFANGVAEFLDLLVRGSFATGPAGQPRIEIDDVVAPIIAFYTADAAETGAATVGAAPFPFPHLKLVSGDFGSGVVDLELRAPDETGNHGGFRYATTAIIADTGRPEVNLTPDLILRLDNTADASLSSSGHAFQIGPSTGLNLAVDNNEIMARNNGAASTLNLNADGGTITCFLNTDGTLDVDGTADISQTLTAGNMKTGTATTPAPGVGGGQSTVAVSFAAMPATPRVYLTPNISAAGTAVVRSWGFTGASTTGFSLHCDRADDNPTIFHWLAVSGMG